MEQKVIELLKRVFEETEITSDSSQETVSEWDSMHQLSIAFEIENEFGFSLEPEEIALMKSVKDIVVLLEKKN
ncbi:acyl carrier protein [Treponema socranskii]|uniref:acyl carrier protein n=1 Tax=Treponema socranskii TaxID=53419 RepID=UPI003D934AA3